MCGAPTTDSSQLTQSLNELLYARTALSFTATFSIYIVDVTNLTATNLGISYSKGMGCWVLTYLECLPSRNQCLLITHQTVQLYFWTATLQWRLQFCTSLTHHLYLEQ